MRGAGIEPQPSAGVRHVESGEFVTVIAVWNYWNDRDSHSAACIPVVQTSFDSQPLSDISPWGHQGRVGTESVDVFPNGPTPTLFPIDWHAQILGTRPDRLRRGGGLGLTHGVGVLQ
ncbi:hypothetical protein GCM10011366_04530 [Ornithinimicrobium tianjinense]|uniref:Uncharacterized protein n=1 Tax=Ornithinimicrobium tianjinense TaxID=1195761 RepID=A0A917BEB4_9MICO|nr:hypothetical protein GCM10011366_04530 [Ornithinimicrobium tianjinense]